MPAPARDVVRDGHADPRVCPCSYHRWLRDAPADQGPDPDDRDDL